MKALLTAKADPYDEKTNAADLVRDSQGPGVVYTRENAPPAPRVEDLPLTDNVSRHGITWTFAKSSGVIKRRRAGRRDAKRRAYRARWG